MTASTTCGVKKQAADGRGIPNAVAIFKHTAMIALSSNGAATKKGEKSKKGKDGKAASKSKATRKGGRYTSSKETIATANVFLLVLIGMQICHSFKQIIERKIAPLISNYCPLHISSAKPLSM